jgi:hypothetical protein
MAKKTREQLKAELQKRIEIDRKAGGRGKGGQHEKLAKRK